MSSPNRGKPLSYSRSRPNDPTQTDITGGKPVRHYTIPSSTIVIQETERRTNPTGHPKGPEQPKPNLLRWPHSGRSPGENPYKRRAGPPSLPPARNPAPNNNRIETQYNRNNNEYKTNTDRPEWITKWNRSIKIKIEAYLPPGKPE